MNPIKFKKTSKITPINPPKPATSTVSIFIGTSTKGNIFTINSITTPKSMCSKILIMMPAALNSIIRPMAIKTAITIPNSTVSRIINFSFLT